MPVQAHEFVDFMTVTADDYAKADAAAAEAVEAAALSNPVVARLRDFYETHQPDRLTLGLVAIHGVCVCLWVRHINVRSSCALLALMCFDTIHALVLLVPMPTLTCVSIWCYWQDTKGASKRSSESWWVGTGNPHDRGLVTILPLPVLPPLMTQQRILQMRLRMRLQTRPRKRLRMKLQRTPRT